MSSVCRTQPTDKPARTSRPRGKRGAGEPRDLREIEPVHIGERRAIEDEGSGRLLSQVEHHTGDGADPEPDDWVPFGPAREPEAEEPDEPPLDVVVPREPPRPKPQERRSKRDLPAVRILSTAEIFAPMPPTAWLVRELQLAPGRPALLYGAAGAGKSVIVQSLALHVAAGIPAWGRFPTREGRVLHVDYDQGQAPTRHRYRRLAAGHGIDHTALTDRLRLMSFPPVHLHSPLAVEFLAAHCEDTALCVIDALRGALPGLDENDSRIGAHLGVCARVSSETGTTFVVLHHLGKPKEGSTDSAQSPRGSSAIVAGSGAAILVTGAKEAPKRLRLVRDSESFEGGPSADFTLRIEDLPASGDLAPLRVVYDDAASAPAGEDRRNEQEAAILAHIRAHPGCGVTAVRKATGGNAENVSQAIDRLADRDALRREGGPRNAVRLFVVEREPEAEDEPDP